MIDKGAHFFKCDLQVHTPRDSGWHGHFKGVTDENDRRAFANELVAHCRTREIHAIAITDHHDFCFYRFVADAAESECDSSGNLFSKENRLVVFPGVELTLSAAPSQAILILDPYQSDAALNALLIRLGLTPVPSNVGSLPSVVPLATSFDHESICEAVDGVILNPHVGDPSARVPFAGHYILLPNVKDKGYKTLMRKGFYRFYSEMPCVGGYIEGMNYEEIPEGSKAKLEGRDPNWGSKRIGVIQTGDNRHEDEGGVLYPNLGKWPTWIKWSSPSTEAIRQACLASDSRISHEEPIVPTSFIRGFEVTDSKYLGNCKLAINPQFTAVIGGRGTGKSTVFEYIRWSLCDRGSKLKSAELPDFEKRRAGIIADTLVPLGASVKVWYEKNGVIYEIERSSSVADEIVTVRKQGGDEQRMDGDWLRREFPVVSYAQKELSSVGIMPSEMYRLVSEPIQKSVNENEARITELLPLLKAQRRRSLRIAEIRKLRTQSNADITSKEEQTLALQQSMTDLSEEDKKLIAQQEFVLSGKQWTGRLNKTINELRDILQTAYDGANSFDVEAPKTEWPLSDDLSVFKKAFDTLREEASNILLALVSRTTTLFDDEECQKAQAKLDSFRAEYDTQFAACMERAAKNKTQLDAITGLREEIGKIQSTVTELDAELNRLETLQLTGATLYDEWRNTHAQRTLLLRNQGDVFAQNSGGCLRLEVLECGDKVTIFSHLNNFFNSVPRIMSKEDKLDRLADRFIESGNVLLEWKRLFEEISRIKESSVADEAPILREADFTQKNIEAVRDTVTEELIESSIYPQLRDSVQMFYRPDADDEWIPFEKASPGQQATVLLRTLLEGGGPPLLIDQPEEDLDNEQMSDIAEAVVLAKRSRQLLFVSHNANIVVNGDAELVAIFGTDKAARRKGLIGEGSIDQPEICDKIASIMEGGREAFELRKEKYGF